MVRARAIAKRLDCDLAIIDKEEKASVSEVMNIIGQVKIKIVLIDDICDTAGTLADKAVLNAKMQNLSMPT